MKSFKKIAQQATTLCDLMEDREKIETEDIIKNYGTITLEDFVWAEMGENSCWVYTFLEDREHFAFAGVSIKSILDKLLEEYDGDYQALRAAYTDETLKKDGDVIKLKLEYGKTKAGQRFTKATVV